MKAISTAFAIAILALIVLTSGLNMAHARDLGPYEIIRLHDAKTIQPLEKLNAAALAKHPGATISETDLEEEYGRYLYQIELRDAKGVQWELEFDATSGELLRNHQDN